jgi:hypothetical protein
VIERIEIDKRGTVTLQIGKEHEWYAISGFPPATLDPRQDAAIPLSGLAREKGLQVLAYRPSRRLVVAGREHGADLVWKGYRRRRGAVQADKYSLAASALAGSGIDGARVLEFDSSGDFMILSRAPGRQPRVSAGSAADFHLMGRGVGALQGFGERTETLPVFDRTQELTVLDERLRRLELAGGRAPPDWLSLRASLGQAADRIPLALPVLTHRDLHDKQWLVDGRRAFLLDFDLLCLAEPELDAANFLAHLELRRLQQPQLVGSEDVRACSAAFLDGLGLSLDSADCRTRLEFYRASCFARLALVYLLRPRWRQLVATLVQLGNSHLPGPPKGAR